MSIHEVFFFTATGLTLLILLTFYFRARTEQTLKFMQSLQAFATIFVLILAGYMYFVERKNKNRVNLNQEVIVTKVDRDLVSAEVQIKIENVGFQQIELEQLDVRLKLISPTLSDYNYLAAGSGLSDDEYWSAKRDDGKNLFDNLEFKWPVIRQTKHELENIVEPGEQDLVTVTFMIPCLMSNQQIDTVKVSTSLSNPEKKKYSWKLSSFVNITEACEKDLSLNQRSE